MTSITDETAEAKPDVEQPKSVTDALEFARDYQLMADFLAAHPDLAARGRHDGYHRFLVSVNLASEPLEEIASALRAAKKAGVKVEEYVSTTYGGIQICFGRVRLQVYAAADKVLREVVVGQVPDVRRSLAIDLDGNPREDAEQPAEVKV